jgi:predicted nucleic acid-binding protein
VPFVIDTNVAIRLRDREGDLQRQIGALEGPILLSILTWVELENGVYRDPSRLALRRHRLDAILELLPVVSFDEKSAEAYRRIIEVVGYSRRKLLDRMIAAQAIVHRATLITLNAADFRDIPGLDLIAW